MRLIRLECQVFTFVFIDKYSLTFLFPAGWDNSIVVELLKAEYKRRCLLRPLLWDSTIELPLENVYTRLKIISRRKLAIPMEANMANMFHVTAHEKSADVLTLAQGSPDLRVDVNDEFSVFDFVKAPDKVGDVMRLVEGQKPDLVSGNDEVNVTEIFKTPEKGADVLTLAQGSPDLRVDVNNEFNVFDFFKAPDNVEDVMRLVEGQKPDLVSGNDEVNVTEIFKTLEKGKDVMTLVEGSPGIGKTTFCLKLAYDSTHGKIPTECSFPKFEVVLLLKCRDIDGNIMDTIREQLLPRDIEEKIVEKLLHFLKDIHNQERIFIILDGLDELPEKSRHHVDELLHRRIFPFCYVLATTRQERGIEARKTFVFDIHLEIKGHTESDSIAYVRRHFETIGQSPKGERLIEEMQQNTFLNALRNNPLNLLLLCVVYEDYEGKLPTSRTELYQVIVQCLLRRYCAKRNLSAPEDDSALEKKFEKEILALGELAWLCLLSDRYGFRENELVEFERKYPGLVARELGLLYKEESLKRLKPQHEYCFLHKTFQEYVAAAYIAEKLVNQQFNVFDHFPFDDLVTKYPQVFIFVSGMLGEKATVLFTQIGEELKKSDWDWNWDCNEKEATFFIESFNESGHPEQMAATLCQIIPFPKVITVMSEDDYNAFFVKVLMACKSFSDLQTPAELYADICSGSGEEGRHLVDCIESCPQLTIVSFALGCVSFTYPVADRVCKWLSVSKSLSELTLKVRNATPSDGDLLFQICPGLASCPTLTKLKFSFPGYFYSEGFFNALETGLTPLTSVGLELLGSMEYTATRALQNFLSNKSLKSFSLSVVGADVQDLLVAAVSEALARHKVLKSFDLHFGGPLSSSSANFLEKGLIENSSLNYLRLYVHGELPGNWHSVMENLRLAKNSSVVCSIYPNTWNNVADNLCHPVMVGKGLNLKQHYNVNIWGEMSCEAAEALCEAVALSSITFLTLNVRGNLTNGVANTITRCLEGNQTLSVVSINIWGELTTEGGIVLFRLSKENRSVQLNKQDVRIGPDVSNNVLDINMDNPAALRAFFTKVKERRKEKVSLSINNNGYVTKEWTRCIGDALAENTSLTSLALTVNSWSVDADLGENLGKSLLQSTSLTSLSLTFNVSNVKEGWLRNLGDSLDKMASLTSLSLDVNFHGEDKKGVLSTNVVEPIKSLSTLSCTIHDDRMDLFRNEFVGSCLRECTSLEKLSLTFNVDSYFLDDSRGLVDGLARTTSLNTFCMAIVSSFNFEEGFFNLFESLNDGFLLNASVSTLTVSLTVIDFHAVEFREIFGKGLAMNMSVTTLSLTINECGESKSVIPLVLRHCGVFQYLTRNTSVTTFNLTLNSSKEVSDDWLPGLCEALEENSSLTTLRLKVNNHCATGKSHLYDFSKLLIEGGSLSLLELDVSFYGKESGCHRVLIL